MRVFSSLDLIQAHQWSSSFFTTYALSLSFFEAVVLDSLVRQGVEDNLILADVEGVRGAMAEHGARNVGRTYDVEPVAVEHGCFHPKLMVLISPTEAHVVIGSGNLTFGGWGTNFECVEHLHPAFAGDAFNDVADFLESLATVKTVKYAAGDRCFAMAKQLRARAAQGQTNGHIRILHSLNRSILDQLVESTAALGGAQRLTVASPFYDNGQALDRLCNRLGIDHAFLHVHEGRTVAGSAGSNWPAQAATRIEAAEVELFREQPVRLLHAKAIEIVCRNGRIVLSGSANATIAALEYGRNVEVCVARIEPDVARSWHLRAASPPNAVAAIEPVLPTSGPPPAVLRAVLRGEELQGRILTPFPSGIARVQRLTRSGITEIGQTDVNSDGNFTLKAQDLEEHAWTAQRIILRVAASTGAIAEGFVSFASLAEITRRAGAMAPRLFAVLAGTETPEDIAAVMSFFHENPEYLSPGAIGVGWSKTPTQSKDSQVIVSSLLETSNGSTAHPDSNTGTSAASWHRFMEQLLASFQEPRGPISENSDTADDPSVDTGARPESPRTPRQQPGIKQALVNFDKLFDVMLNKRQFSVAFHMTQFVCDRIEPDAARVKNYLDRLVAGFIENPMVDGGKECACVAILILLAAASVTTVSFAVAAMQARRRLLRVGADLSTQAPDATLGHGFVRILSPGIDTEALWEAIRGCRTAQEEVQAYKLADSKPISKAEFPYLSSTPEWDALAGANRKGISILSRYHASCPIHFIALPSAEAARLRDSAIGRASNCCNRILLCEEL
jgi:hypothetical protein